MACEDGHVALRVVAFRYFFCTRVWGFALTDVNIVKSDCRSCARSTRHEVAAEVTHRVEEWWANELDSWRIVRCQGCRTYSFQMKHEDFDEIEEDENGIHHAVSFDVYPSVVKNHRGVTHTHLLPPLISTIYLQSVKALGQQSTVLGSIGLRACIEAVCNHLDISGTNLQRRIDQLFKGGYVSNGDKKRLHAIRFLGNDAAHEIKQPKVLDIRIALEIVEHLLNTVFILESRAAGLETVAENYTDFMKLLERCASEHKSGTSINLLGLLGKRRRLIAVSLETFEAQLMSDIDNGKVGFLKKSPTQIVEEREIQFYEVEAEYFAQDDDEIPF